MPDNKEDKQTLAQQAVAKAAAKVKTIEETLSDTEAGKI